MSKVRRAIEHLSASRDPGLPYIQVSSRLNQLAVLYDKGYHSVRENQHVLLLAFMEQLNKLFNRGCPANPFLFDQVDEFVEKLLNQVEAQND